MNDFGGLHKNNIHPKTTLVFLIFKYHFASFFFLSLGLLLFFAQQKEC